MRVVGRAPSTTRWNSISGSAPSASVSADAGVVVADHADEDAAGAERDQVARHIAGAADHQFAALDRDHRRRRLRRDARDLAIDELVQHQVADAEHGLTAERGEIFAEVEHLADILLALIHTPFIPAQAGIQEHRVGVSSLCLWVPACAGTSGERGKSTQLVHH